jgi:hypothetical protein
MKNPRGHPALGLEFPERRQHGVVMDAHALGQIPDARQGHARPDAAIADGALDTFGHLPVQRTGSTQLQVHIQFTGTHACPDGLAERGF